MNFKNFRVANQQDHLVAEFAVTNVAGFVGRLTISTANGSVDDVTKHFHNCEKCVFISEETKTTVIFFGDGDHYASMSKGTDPASQERDDLVSSIDYLEKIDIEDLISRGFNNLFAI